MARADGLLVAGTGLLILGDPGVGKSAFARELGRRAVASGAAVGEVFGHAVSSGVPFEAFAGVLAEPPGQDTTELGVAEVVSRLTTANAAPPGVRSVLVVDDVQRVDERSAQVLLQLAATGAATVVATAPRQAVLPEAANRLWRDGWCERIDLAPLPVGDVAALLEAVLDGPVDERAVRAFADRSGGNPLLLRELVTAARDQSALIRRGVDGSRIWLLTGEPPVTSGIREVVTANLVGIAPEFRAALELVAAGEPLSAAMAADLVGDAVLDQLATDRLITVREGLAGPEVMTAHPIYGEVLRAELPALRLHRLRLGLAHRLEEAEQPSPHDLVRAVVWRLESGQGNDPDRLLTAARAARSLSFSTAERLARHAYESSGSLPAALLLAEILTHTGRFAEAVELTAQLPPESLSAADRDAIAYCTAVGQGIAIGDPSGGAELIAGVLAGVPGASDQLRALHAVLLDLDARFSTALAVASPIMNDQAADPATRTLAAQAAVGAAYWLGQLREAVTMADRIRPVATDTRAALPFSEPSIEMIATCALLEYGDVDAAEERAYRLHRDANGDEFSTPRADYCLGRAALHRGQAETARRLFGRCLAGLSAFDAYITRHVTSLLARAAAACGDVESARSTLDAAADCVPMKIYEPEFDLAEAALLAASLRMDLAAERAAWAAGVAADQSEWSVALGGYHDAARYGGAREVLRPMRDAAAHVDGTLAWCYLDHAAALAARDPAALNEVARRFEAHGALLFAAEAAAEAALAHAAVGHNRPARASGAQAARLRSLCESAPSPWLAGAVTAVPLTARERQVAALAAAGLSDAAIAERLDISIRTVQTHLSRVYDKLGSQGRADLAARLGG